MSKKESRRYTLKDCIDNPKDKRLVGREGEPCYFAQSKSKCLDNAQEYKGLGTFIGIDDSSFFGPFKVKTLLGVTDTYCIIFEE